MAKTGANTKDTAEKGAKTSSKPKKRMVTIDDSPEDVLKWDNEGWFLTFDSRKDKFLKLDDDVIRELSGMTAAAYGISLGMNERDADNTEGRPVFETFQPADPRDRLRVEGQKPGMKYYWARPDKMYKHEREAGYRVAQTNVETFNGAKQVKMHGQTELVLMETTEENVEKARRVKRERERVQQERMDLADKARLSQYGGRYYDESEDSRDSQRPWSGPKDE